MKQRATTAEGTRRRNLDIHYNWNSSQSNLGNPEYHPAQHERQTSQSRISQQAIPYNLNPEGVEMAHLILDKKETDSQLQQLQNRLNLLRRQERLMTAKSSQNLRQQNRISLIRRTNHRDQLMTNKK